MLIYEGWIKALWLKICVKSEFYFDYDLASRFDGLNSLINNTLKTTVPTPVTSTAIFSRG
jgi:hypothetical protein